MGYDTNESIASELVLLAGNDYELYKQQVEPITKNLDRKIAKGIFNKDKAAVLVKYLMDNVSKKYAKHYGGTFSPNIRRLAASIWVDEYLNNKSIGV